MKKKEKENPTLVPEIPAKAQGSRKKKATKKSKIANASVSKRKTIGKRERGDGVDGSVIVAQNALRDIQPPEHVRFIDRDYPFWDAIVLEYAKIEWSPHALHIAALLARAVSDLEREQFWMRHEGSLMEEKRRKIEKANKRKGAKEIVIITNIINPRAKLIDQHTKNIMGLRRSLAIHARGLGGEARDVAARRAAAKEIESGVAAAMDDDDGLIAKPKVH